MKTIIPFTNIASCGVWHKAPRTLSSLDEAITALGTDCCIINGNTFTFDGRPSDAYTINGIDYHTGGVQFGYAMNGDKIRWSYLSGGCPDFICAYRAFMHDNGRVETGLTGSTRRTSMGLTKDGVYIHVTDKNYTIQALLNEAKADGCVSWINLDGGGSSQFAFPNGSIYYGTQPRRKCLTWVYFKLIQGGNSMSVKTYSKYRDGNINLSTNSKLFEFASKDGADMVLVDTRLPGILQDIRAACGNKPVRINSGYRTPAHNAAVKGAANSPHMKGIAADIRIIGVSTLTICRAAEGALASRKIPGGIGRYIGQNFVHVDTRMARWRGQQDKAGQALYNVAGWALAAPPAALSVLRRGSKGEAVKTVQAALNTHGHKLVVDGDFGTKTDTAVRAFQRSKSLAVDGVVGRNTYSALGVT